MTCAFWSAKHLDLEAKESLMKKLVAIDEKSDWLENTRKYCEAAHTGNKAKLWKDYFDMSETSPCKDWGLHHFQHSFAGFNQPLHADEIKAF